MTENNQNNRTNDADALSFWDTLVHKKKRISFEEYCHLSKNISHSNLFSYGKKAFSSLALCGFLMYLVVYLIQILIYSCISIFTNSPDFLQKISVDISALSFAVLAFPVLYMLTSFMPKVVPQKNNLSVTQLILFGIASIGLVYVGNLIGIGITEVVDFIVGKESVSPINQAVEGLSPYKVLFYFVIFPAVFEELIFRKLLIDRTAFFGETASVLFSALFFALYHMNFYQFFYAFLVGYLFGIIYIKTGKITSTITLHGFINFIGTGLPTMLGKVENFNVIYNTVFMILGLIGIIVILLGLSYAKSKNGRYTKFVLTSSTLDITPPSLEGKDAIKSVILNPGMIIFIVFSIINFFSIY